MVTFPYGVLGRVRYLIVAILDLCLLSYVWFSKERLRYKFCIRKMNFICTLSYYDVASESTYKMTKV